MGGCSDGPRSSSTAAQTLSEIAVDVFVDAPGVDRGIDVRVNLRDVTQSSPGAAKLYVEDGSELLVSFAGEEKSISGSHDYTFWFNDAPSDVRVTLLETHRGGSLVVPLSSPFRIVAPAEFTLGDTIEIALSSLPRRAPDTTIGFVASGCLGSAQFTVSEVPFFWDTKTLVPPAWAAASQDGGIDSGTPEEPCHVGLQVEVYTHRLGGEPFHPETRTIARRSAAASLIAHRDR